MIHEEPSGRGHVGLLAAIAGVCAVLLLLAVGLLTSIFERKTAGANRHVRLVR